MKWFEEFGELSWFIIGMLAIALICGILSAIRRDKVKLIMIATGIAEAGILAALLICYLANGAAAKAIFSDVDMNSALFTLLVVGVVAAMLIMMLISGRREKWTARDTANAAMCVAMSFILSCVKIYEMPQGGTITPASLLPITLYIAAFGPAKGLVVGFAYGLLQLLQGAYVIHPAQLLLDYPVAFGALALGGFARYLKIPRALKLPAAVVLGYLGRYAMAVLSGAIFFAEYAGEQNAWIYSVIYNISYIAPDCAACAAVSLIPGFARLTDALKARR